MKISVLLVAGALLCVCYSCHKEASSQQVMIVGKWTFQKEHSVYTLNGLKQIDTVIPASKNNKGNITFGNNGTFTSTGDFSSYYVKTTEQLALTGNSTSGVYGINDSMISFGSPVAQYVGIINSNTSGTAPYGFQDTTHHGFDAVPVVQPPGKIIQLTAHSLIFQTEYTGKVAVAPADSVTADNLTVYYFIK